MSVDWLDMTVWVESLTMAPRLNINMKLWTPVESSRNPPWKVMGALLSLGQAMKGMFRWAGPRERMCHSFFRALKHEFRRRSNFSNLGSPKCTRLRWWPLHPTIAWYRYGWALHEASLATKQNKSDEQLWQFVICYLLGSTQVSSSQQWKNVSTVLIKCQRCWHTSSSSQSRSIYRKATANSPYIWS